MNWLDIVILIILVLSAFGGLKNGLIKSLLSLIGLIVGVVLAGRFYESFSGVLSFISSERAAHIAAFVIIFLLVIIIFQYWGLIQNDFAILLGWLNRLPNLF
jgi:membrane protein required for colicin V production